MIEQLSAAPTTAEQPAAHPRPAASRRVRRLIRFARRNSLVGQCVLFVIAVLALFPIYFMIDNALRTGPETTASPFALATKPLWHNFILAWQASSGAYVQSTVVVSVSVLGIAVTTLLSGYAFARLRFRERELLFYVVFGLLLIPQFIILIPLYVEIKDLGLLGSRWGLILPYIAAGQALGAVVMRTFIAGIPEELFEAAKLDGANDFWLFRRLVVPLSAPVMIALGILNLVALWGDYVFPNLVLQDDPTVAVSIVGFTPPALSPVLNSYNIQLAAFTLASVPIAVIIFLLMKYFVLGMSQNALKI